MTALTFGQGKRRPQGQLVELDSSDLRGSLKSLLVDHTGVETWWSGAVFNDNYRQNDRWISQQVIGLDVDYSDPIGQHAPLTDEARQVLVAAFPGAPCAFAHLTPRGARLIVVLDKPIVDRLMFPLAWSSLHAHLSLWVPRVEVGSLEIDKTCRDLARYFWAPRATVDGVARGN